jgi:methylmalonic aciduria homocystinuria type C protein
LVQPFGLAAFHRASPPELHLETFGRENALALVLGNSRALWPRFLDAVARTPEITASAHPLDDYVSAAVTRALEAAPTQHVAYFSHLRTPKLIAIQRIAHAAGLAELGPAHISVHPVHGPWIGLRAVITFDLDFYGTEKVGSGAVGPGGPPQSYFAKSHCQTCSKPCAAALDRALAQTGEMPSYGLVPAVEAQNAAQEDLSSFPSNALDESSRKLEATLGPHKLAWLAIRDACPVGQASRYSSRQIAYHYGKSLALLLPRD